MERKWKENGKKILSRTKLKFATFSRLALRPEPQKRNFFKFLQTIPKQSEEETLNLIPIETALKIVSSLQVSNVCSLGSCSRFWRELCGSDCVWESLYRERWPALNPQTKPSLMGWRECYINKHKDVDRFATHVVQQFSGIETIEVGQYLSIIEGMCLIELGFKDVQMFFFKQKLSAMINLIGLHYCISWLGVPVCQEYLLTDASCLEENYIKSMVIAPVVLASDKALHCLQIHEGLHHWFDGQTAHVGEALDSCKISERVVCVMRRKIIGWCGDGFMDGYLCRTFSLADIASGNEDEVLGVLRDRVPVPERFRVQISVKNLDIFC